MTDGPIARKRLKRATQRSLTLGASAAVGVLILGAVAYWGISFYLEKSAQSRKASQESAILHLVEELSKRIDGVSQAATALSKDPGVRRPSTGKGARWWPRAPTPWMSSEGLIRP